MQTLRSINTIELLLNKYHREKPSDALCSTVLHSSAIAVRPWGRPLLPEILGQPAAVRAKSPIVNR